MEPIMTSEEREARLTAYALNDSGVTSTERHEIESLLASDSAARLAVEETRQLASVLGEGLAAEQAAMPASKAVTIPAAKPAAPKPPTRIPYFVAATVALFAVAGGTFLVWSNWQAKQEKNRILANSQPIVGYESDLDYKYAQDPNDIPSITKSWDASTATSDDSKNDALKKRTASEGAADPVIVAPTKRDGGRSNLDAPDSTSKPGEVPPVPGPPVTPGIPGRPASPSPNPNNEAKPRADGAEGKPEPRNSRPGSDKTPSSSKNDPNKESGKGKDDKGDGKPVTAVPLEEFGAIVIKGAKGTDEAPAELGTNDRFPGLVENSFIKVQGLDALSTFGVDVDTASYAIVRKYLTSGQMPPVNAVRLEEMVNYFPYQDKAPDGADPFAVTVEMADCPWQPQHRLVRVGLKAKPIASDKRPPSNLVFLIDVSGSMDQPNKLPLVKAGLKLLVNQLGENDRVAMVVYAGASGLVLDSTPATKKETILNALDNLQAGGSTNGAGGLQQAYDVAVKNFIKKGTNRVILCTDGDWNVGTTSTEALVKMVEEKRETGVFLSVFGFGMGNLRDEMMVKIAGKGNGNYGYIDQLKEAQKAFVEQMGGTLVTVAKDVKIQIEFNPAAIKSYRLLGYEKRLLAAKDFHDDKKDAGEMGAGHVVTALYELVPVGVADPIVGKTDPLRYQKEPEVKPVVKSDKVNEAFVVKMRHKEPDGDTSTLREVPVSNVSKDYSKASEDFQFAASVASFAMLLKDSPYKGSSNYSLVLELADAAKSHDPGEYRAEFIDLVKKAKSLSGK
jgi:Ca-activated chloride channel family protein